MSARSTEIGSSKNGNAAIWASLFASPEVTRFAVGSRFTDVASLLLLKIKFSQRQGPLAALAEFSALRPRSWIVMNAMRVAVHQFKIFKYVVGLVAVLVMNNKMLWDRAVCLLPYPSVLGELFTFNRNKSVAATYVPTMRNAATQVFVLMPSLIVHFAKAESARIQAIAVGSLALRSDLSSNHATFFTLRASISQGKIAVYTGV
jgi:hypothetical protein